MKTYICKDMTESNFFIPYPEPCDCEYREVTPGEWEFRYQGSGYGNTDWITIKERSLDEIRGLGHNPVEVKS